MTKPNEDINEELSTDELKDVSGGIMVPGEGTNLKGVSGGRSSFPDTEGHWGEGEGLRPNSPHGSGFGGTLKDWEREHHSLITDDGSPETDQ